MTGGNRPEGGQKKRNLLWCAIHSPCSTVLGRALRVIKLPLTMCLAYEGLSHSGSGRGRWYDVSTSSAVGRILRRPPDSSMPMVCASDGELGRGGSLARLETD